MRSPASAIAWELRTRHHWGVIAIAAYLVVLSMFKSFILTPGQVVVLDPPDSTAAIVFVPFSLTFMYLVAVFTYGLAGDLAGRHSIYPARMFALPLTTSALAGWPMLYGGIAMTILWLTLAVVARTCGIVLPFVWPGLLFVAFLAWTQALMWMPYGLPGLRVVVSVVCLAALDAVVLLAIELKISETTMIAFLAPQIPIAYLVAWRAIALARRGDVPDWRRAFAMRRVADGATQSSRPFRSHVQAQAWLEWRQHGGSLPGWMAILLPCELALLFLVRPGAPDLVFYVIAGVLITPIAVAAFVAPALREQGVAPFAATRPITSGALVMAKVWMTMRTTLVTWLLVLAAIAVALKWSGTWPALVGEADRVTRSIGTPRAMVLALLVTLALCASTWKQLVQGLYIGLARRPWLARAHAALLLLLLVFIWPVVHWILNHDSAIKALWEGLPWILAALACAKLSIASWIAVQLQARRVLEGRTLIIGVAAWVVAVFILRGILVWLFDTPYVPSYALTLIAILAIPLVRLSAAPLALATGRHQ